MIVAWNGLKNAHTIGAGQQLALYIDRGGKKATRSTVAKVTQTKTTDLVVLKASKKKTRATKTGSQYQWYSVKNGDSLWTISRKFSASTADIKKWNKLKSNLIHPGSKLKLKKV